MPPRLAPGELEDIPLVTTVCQVNAPSPRACATGIPRLPWCLGHTGNGETEAVCADGRRVDADSETPGPPVIRPVVRLVEEALPTATMPQGEDTVSNDALPRPLLPPAVGEAGKRIREDATDVVAKPV